MTKYLIIPDIHNNIRRVDQIIEKYHDVDKIIFLGDYFDDYGDSILTAGKVAEWLRQSLKDKTRTHLMGNHDLHYLNSNYRYGGYSDEKKKAIQDTGVDLSLLHDYTWVEDYLCTHAGLSNEFFQKYRKGNDIHTFLRNLPKEKYDCGPVRGGSKTPGIFLADWVELIPIKGVHQVLGHTPGWLPRKKGDNVTIDTRLRHIAFYDDDSDDPNNKLMIKAVNIEDEPQDEEVRTIDERMLMDFKEMEKLEKKSTEI